MSQQTRVMLTTTTITDTTVTIDSLFQSRRLVDVVTRDGSEDTNCGTKFVAHKNACEASPAAQTAPPMTSLPLSAWVKSKSNSGAVTVTGANATISVPTGNSGVIQFNITQNDGTNFQYSKNGGAMTTKVNGDQITLVNGDTLKLQCTALDVLSTCQGNVTDVSTGVIIDSFLLQNLATA